MKIVKIKFNSAGDIEVYATNSIGELYFCGPDSDYMWQQIKLPPLPGGAVVLKSGVHLTPGQTETIHGELEAVRDAIENKNTGRALDRVENLIQTFDLIVEPLNED